MVSAPTMVQVAVSDNSTDQIDPSPTSALSLEGFLDPFGSGGGDIVPFGGVEMPDKPRREVLALLLPLRLRMGPGPFVSISCSAEEPALE